MRDAHRILVALTLGVVAMSSACHSPDTPPARSEAEKVLDAKVAQYAPFAVGLDLGQMPHNERNALAFMIDAARLMDTLFLEQVWAGNPALLLRLAEDRSAVAQAELRYFLINKGPFDRLDHMHGFANIAQNWVMPDLPKESGLDPKTASQADIERAIEARTAQVPRSSFYPSDSTKDEVEKWINGLSGEAHTEATSFFTVIRRGPNGKLMAVPYSLEYQNVLAAAASLLRRAADETAQPSLKRYLELRADALLSNDYYASDVAWMELDATIEPTIGPYETYEDQWFGYKAAFEAFITVRDDEETKKLETFSHELQGLEDALPIDPKYRNPKLGALAPIRVVNVVFSAGDGNRGVQTAAFNLPNDDRVIREKGSKRVMLKNMQDAKFEQVLLPISKVALAPADRAKVSFDAFFTHILMHELMHGLGPHQVAGTAQPVRLALKDTYSAIEEAKADISGLWSLRQLADQKKIPAAVAQTMYTTFLASAFRSIRFGVGEAHGKGIALQLNYLLDHGGVTVNADGTFGVVEAKFADAVTSLTREIMTLQVEGNYAKAQEMLRTLGVVRPEVQRVLDKLKGVPVDIAPRFVTAETLMPR
jgi:hypothetical protein